MINKIEKYSYLWRYNLMIKQILINKKFLNGFYVYNDNLVEMIWTIIFRNWHFERGRKRLIYFKQGNIDEIVKEYLNQGLSLGIDFYFLLESDKFISNKSEEIIDNCEWKQVEFFEKHWETRVRQMAQLISNDSVSVMDLGCGEGKLRNYLSDSISYIGVDYCEREKVDNLICDFNKGEFPNINCDTIFISGCLEYVEDYENFVTNIANHCNKEIIISFCVLELFRDVKQRKSIGQKCFLSTLELSELFYKNGYVLEYSEFWNNTPIFRFIKED